MSDTHEYAFDVKLWTVVRVKATSEKRARAILHDFAECLDIGTVADHHNRTDFQEGEEIRFTEASSEGDYDLFEINGEDPDMEGEDNE